MLQMKNFPQFAVWLAQDESGDWWVYECEPLQHDTGWYENEIGRSAKMASGNKKERWYTTLTKLNQNSRL